MKCGYSFVGNKANKQWIWLAIDFLIKEIVGVYIGQTDKHGDRRLVNYLPAVYRQCAVTYTDFCPFLCNIFSSKKT